MPPRHGFAPNRLAQHQGRLDREWRVNFTTSRVCGALNPLSAAEEQMVRTLAERTHAFLRELNPVQRVIDQAEECWVHEVLPEAVPQGHERALWETALGVMS
jgi:hypothetical protein